MSLPPIQLSRRQSFAAGDAERHKPKTSRPLPKDHETASCLYETSTVSRSP